MNFEDLHVASYGGAEFFINGINTSGGRKDSKKQIINSDLQIIEDLGLQQRIFAVNGTIAARRDISGNEIISYQDSRDKLLGKLELGQRQILVHPFYGRIENVVARSWSLNEDLKNLGEGIISITFEISNTDGIPQVAENVLSFIESSTQFVMDKIELDIELNYSIWVKAAGNFQDALDKANAIPVALRAATDPLVTIAEEINAFTAGLTEFGANVASLVLAPVQLADSVVSLIASVNGIYTAADGAYEAFISLFDFGDDDVELDTETFGQANRQDNRDRINYAIQAGALSQAYYNASKMEYSTVDEINAIAEVLENQYAKLFAAIDIDSEVLNGLTELRIAAEGFFDDQKLKASQIIVVRTNPISIRGLAFQYYGSSDLGDDIGELNEFADGALISGNVQILTE